MIEPLSCQACSTFQEMVILQKKAVRIINFQPRNSHTSPLLKFQDQICLDNILFVSKSFNNLSPSVFSMWFSFSSGQYNYETPCSTQGNFIKQSYKTNRYGKYSITGKAVESWSKIHKQLKIRYLKIYSPIKLKQLSVILF